jgi:hypothetical protein
MIKTRWFSSLVAGGLGLTFTLTTACGGSPKPAPEPVAKTAAPSETPGQQNPEAALDEAQCNEAIDHAVEVLKADPQTAAAADTIAADKAPHVAECLKSGNRKDYDCVMAAKTAADLGACEPPDGHE